ncbi:hypothetical protein ES703_21625 [subsurface metagenome]
MLEPPGSILRKSELRIPKAQGLVQYLEGFGEEAFVKLLQVRRNAEPPEEVVVIEVDVERPQKLTYDIRKHEVLAVVFPESDDRYPEVLALREDFPLVPHLNLNTEEYPRNLCLYEEPYVSTRLNWTAARYLRQIRYWLARTAAGTLHGEDQPLEPLIQQTPWRLIVPADFKASKLLEEPRLLDICNITSENSESTFVAKWEAKEATTVSSIVAAFSLPPQTHGVIRHCPVTLL